MYEDYNPAALSYLQHALEVLDEMRDGGKTWSEVDRAAVEWVSILRNHGTYQTLCGGPIEAGEGWCLVATGLEIAGNGQWSRAIECLKRARDRFVEASKPLRGINPLNVPDEAKALIDGDFDYTLHWCYLDEFLEECAKRGLTVE